MAKTLIMSTNARKTFFIRYLDKNSKKKTEDYIRFLNFFE